MELHGSPGGTPGSRRDGRRDRNGRSRDDEERRVRHEMASGRTPPADVEAEKAILSSILLDNGVMHSMIESLREEDFYHPAHQILFGSMKDLDARNQPIDLLVLADFLEGEGLLEAVGGPVALAEIADHEATPANAVHYGEIVREKALKRSLIGVGTEIVGFGFEPAESADDLLDQAEARVFALSQARARSTLRSLRDEMNSTVDHIEALMNRGDALTGLPTGFRELDKLTGGLQPGDLIILAARPSMGKTALALNLARNAAIEHRKHAAVFSVEMTTRALVMRMLSSEAEVDFANFNRGLISSEAHTRIVQAASRLAEAPIWIDDSDGPSVLEIRAKARRMHARDPLDLVVVDYLQLLRGDRRIDSREQEISEISRGLKGLAKELNIPVIALSQLNRGPETRKAEDKRPMLADLRESGAIEQDADVIAFIYRDIVYNKETEYEDLAELIVAKQRNGPTDTVRLRFEGRYARFADWTQEDYGSLGSEGPRSGPGAGGFAGDPGATGFEPGPPDAFGSDPPF